MTTTPEDRSDRRLARLLLVEDDPDDARRIRAHLEESDFPCDLMHVDTLEAALAALDEGPFDLCLLDLSLPDSPQVETDDRLWARAGELPFVVMADLDELDRAMAALQTGAEQYLVKDAVTPGVLIRLLRTVQERDRARREQRNAEEKWATVFEASPVAVVLSDADSGRLIEVNDAFVEMFGPSREELLGKTSLELGHWADPDRRRELVERVKEDGHIEGEEALFRDAEGHLGRMRLSCRRLELAEGARLLWTVQDVTEWTEQKERLRRSEARYRTLVETMAEATVIYEPEGRITFANAEAEKLLGLEASDILGRTYADTAWRLPTPGDEPFPEEKLPFRRVMTTGRPVRDVELGFERPDGIRRIVSVNATLLSGDDDTMEGVVATFRDVTDRHRMEEELRHRSLHDALTGLPNRTLFWDRLEHARERSRRTGAGLAVLFLDLDGFKRINDERGHGAGDDALRQVADRLRAGVRDADTLARLGGDEFGVLLEDLEDVSEVEEVAGRLMSQFDAPISVAGEEALVRASCGIALAGGDATEEAVTADEMVHRADRAMYAAKAEPGSTFRQFGPGIAEEQTGRLRREIDLKEALENGDVVPHYQPLVDLSDGRIVGGEALARWIHPERGLVAPRAFIPLAEETGLIVELGRQVVRAVCGQVATWRDEDLLPPDFRLHVNLSARELDRPDVVDGLEALFREFDLDPRRVAFEVTETVAIASSQMLERIRALGSPVAVDDFGTGYATLERLASLEFDSLKLDRLFVDRIGTSDRHEAVLEASLTLANSMGLSPVAEGVETEEQRAWLLEHGCQLAQGFLFARPVPAEAFTGWLRSGRRLAAGTGPARP